MDVKNVDLSLLSVTFETEAGNAMIYKGRIISQIGFITPAEKKKMMRQYHAIIKK